MIIQPYREFWECRRAEPATASVCFSLPQDGKLIASGDEYGYIKIWDVQTMASVSVRAHSLAVTSVAFSPDGKTLASGSKDKTVRFWERV